MATHGKYAIFNQLLKSSLKFMKNKKCGATTQEEATHVKKISKIFSGNDFSRGKKYAESEFDIFKSKKCFPDPGKACILKRKVAKIAFLQLFASIYRSSLN
jgi:hypothetical protein